MHPNAGQADDCEDGKRAWDRHNVEEAATAHGSGGARVKTEGGEARNNPASFVREVQGPTHLRGHQYGNITIGGRAPVQIGDVINCYSYTTFPRADTSERPVRPAQASFTGAYAHSSLQPVATYVPRLELEHRLHEQLAVLPNSQSHEMRTVVVWGLGGAGKSQLVLNHVQGRRRQYQGVFWIEAGRKGTIERDYVQIYKQLCRPLHPSVSNDNAMIPVDDAIAGVKSWLQGQERRCLWVMDSADEVEDDTSEFYIDLAHYLPDAPRLDRIVTTRSSRIQGMSSQGAIEVKEMTAKEAVDLFRRCANLLPKSEHDEQEGLTIVKELGCLALAVTLAGSYVHEDPEMSSDLGLYLSEFRQHRAQLLSQKPHRLVHQYGESVLSTWEISYGTIQRQSSLAAKLLNVLAFLNFDDIFLDLFVERPAISTSNNYEDRVPGAGLWSISSQLFKRKQRSIQDCNIATVPERPRWVEILSSDGGTVNHDSIKSAFKTLSAYSLVSWRGDQQAYSMHKLVHAWGHDRLSVELGRAWSSAVLEFLSIMVHDHQGDLKIGRRLVPHVIANFVAVSSAYEGGHQVSAEDRDGLGWMAFLLHRLGRWDDEYGVRVFLRQAMKVTLGLEHPYTLTSINNLAQVLKEQGKYAEAGEMHRQELKLSLKVRGLEHPDTLTSMNNLALVLSDQGKYEQAEEMHRQTLELRKTVLGLEHPHTLTSVNNLAQVLKEQGKYAEAGEMQQEELKLSSKVRGLEHPDTLTSMNNLASMLSDQGKYEQAEEMHQQTLELRKAVLGLEHPHTLQSMNNLASMLSDQGKYEQAEEMHRQTLELRKTVLGLEHPSTLASMGNLAKVLSRQGEHTEAEKMHRQTLGLMETVLGLEHPYTLTSMDNLAEVLYDQGKYEQAEKIYRQTLELSSRVLGLEHPSTLTSMNNLAEVLYDQGKYEQAEKIYRQTLKLSSRVLGLEHASTVTSMDNLAEVLYDQGKYEQAEKIYRQTLELSSRVLGLEHPSTLTSMNNLAKVLYNQGKYEQAEKIYRQTLELMETVLGLEHPSTVTSMDNLAEVLRNQGKHEEATALRTLVTTT